MASYCLSGVIDMEGRPGQGGEVFAMASLASLAHRRSSEVAFLVTIAAINEQEVTVPMFPPIYFLE